MKRFFGNFSEKIETLHHALLLSKKYSYGSSESVYSSHRLLAYKSVKTYFNLVQVPTSVYRKGRKNSTTSILIAISTLLTGQFPSNFSYYFPA